MPKITPLKFREVCNKLKKLGFQGPVPGGRHPLMVRGSIVVPVPNHGGKDVTNGVLESIIDRLGISRQERLDL